MQEMVERYLAAWNEKDAERRRELVDALWTEDGSYTDPLADATGGPRSTGSSARSSSSSLASCSRSAGRSTRTTTRRGSPGTWARAGAEPVVVGFDVAVLNGGGQIRSVYGFLDKVRRRRAAPGRA